MKRTSHLKKAELSHPQSDKAPDTASDQPVAAVAASPDHGAYQRDPEAMGKARDVAPEQMFSLLYGGFPPPRPEPHDSPEQIS
jgi:hypothetical protein